MVKKADRDAITAQCLDEIAFARKAKTDKIPFWHKNEDLYYSRKPAVEGDRANVNLNEAQSFVTTFLSKINSPFNWKYVKGEEADLQAAKIANALKDQDSKVGRWNFKAMLARIQLIIYGRWIMEYHADSSGGYKSYLTNVDVYQFLIDPSCGGEDLEKAWYMGRGGIIKSKQDIKAGIKSGKYLKTEGNELISGSGNLTDETEEDRNAKNRQTALSQARVLMKTNQWKFWEWYTNYEGERYYVLLTEQGGKAIRVEKLTDVFKNNKYPFVSAAAYPDLTEFWTPSPLDGVREAIMAKATAINQMLDNGEAINRPMKAFDVEAIKNPSLLKYRKDGLIPVKGNTDISKAIQQFPVTPITTAIQVFEKMDEVMGINSGITAGTKGQASEKQVGIYEGNQSNIQDRFSLYSDSEADAQQRLAELYLDGLDEHLKVKVAVEMIGIDGVEFKEVTRKDLKRGRNFNVMVITTGAEEKRQTTEKKNKLTFLSSKSADQAGIYNKKILAEMEASIAGFTPDEIKAMTDVKNDGSAELMSECAQDIQRMLAGEVIEPNEQANTAYMQKIRDYMKDNSTFFLKRPEIQNIFFSYLDEIQKVVMANMVEQLDEQLAKEGLMSTVAQGAGMGGQAIVPAVDGASADTTAVDQMTLANYGKK